MFKVYLECIKKICGKEKHGWVLGLKNLDLEVATKDQ